MKQKPKSCSCEQCRLSRIKQLVRTKEERAFRRKANAAVKQGKELIAIAPYGDYTA